jgi:hypothetical protein
MKKFIIAFIVVFVTNLGCKKIIEQPLCACSPVVSPYLSLVITSANNEDLLDSKTNGALTKDQIQLYYKEANGTIKQIDFGIRQPFSFGSEQYKYFQLFSQQIGLLAKSVDDSFYLKLGNDKLYELNLKINNNRVEKLFIDKKEAPFEHSTTTTYSYVNSIFLLKI